MAPDILAPVLLCTVRIGNYVVSGKFTLLCTISVVCCQVFYQRYMYIGWYLRHLERQVVIAGAREIPYNYNTPKLTETAPFF